MEAVCYYAYWASTELAEERGRYSSYQGSLWDRGILPQDTLDLLAEERGGYVEVDTLDHAGLGRAARSASPQHGMRNSNCVAIAPTATISNIIGVDASIEPTLRQPVGQVQPVGRVHGRQRVPGARPEAPRPVGRGDGHRPEALRRLAAPRSTACPRTLKALYATAFEVETHVAGRSRGAAPEVDRPGAVAQHLHGRRLGQEARRDLQAGLAARPEDHLLPAHAGRDARREIDREGGPAECGVQPAADVGAVGARCSSLRRRRATSPQSDIKFCAIDDPIARRVSEHADACESSIACAHARCNDDATTQARCDVNECLVFRTQHSHNRRT